MTDIEIAQNCEKENIVEVAKKIGLLESDLYLYGNDKAKVSFDARDTHGNLVLVTAMNPTPYGEGKTTVSIGLGDALRQLGEKSVIVLREPSMGPVFGIKGGATGGGYSQVVPMEDINLHFTGDFHAITSANDLLCAAIDNHIYHGNSLDIQKVVFHRCLDVNDRALRHIQLDDGREELFSITAASEIMALFCLAENFDDLKYRLGNIVIGYNSHNEMIYARDLKIEGSLAVLLKDAFLPNLVQTLEHTPTIIHGGPFANIAHGCNSVVATKLGLSLGDYVITEAGFGADLGAEKFLDIKCRSAQLKPKCIVLVATIKALKYNAFVKEEDIYQENVEAVRGGLPNLKRHIDNLLSYQVPVVVCLNQYSTDFDSEIEVVEQYCHSLNIPFARSKAYMEGGHGAVFLAEKVRDACSMDSKFQLLYEDSLSIQEKIDCICQKIYHASSVSYSDVAAKKIDKLQQDGLSHLPICIAKTQYSFSDDAKKLGAPENFSVFVRDVSLYHGAGFITVLLGNIMTMPGLSKKPNYELIDYKDGQIIGLS